MRRCSAILVTVAYAFVSTHSTFTLNLDSAVLEEFTCAKIVDEVAELLKTVVLLQIEKDLHRTFPGHPVMDSSGRNALRRLLAAYARRNPSVGYCQVPSLLFWWLSNALCVRWHAFRAGSLSE